MDHSLSPPSDSNSAVSQTGPTYAERLAVRREDLSRQLGAIFAGPARFTWELGCGHGHFLTAYAAAHPGELCIGVDIMSDRIARAEKKRDRARLGNLFFLRTDARLFLEVLPAHVAFSELFILFPDPWPKARHHKHRILQTAFLTEAAQRSTPDGRLSFRTDYKPYFEEARRAVEQHPAWRQSIEAWPFEFDTVFQSRAVEHHSLIARRAPLPAQP